MIDHKFVKVLVVCGPTATGKTSLALGLAQKFKGDVISADSRQVYKGLDIVTGKDIPKGFKKQRDFYTDGQTKIWGLDVVTPLEEWNVGEFQKFAFSAIEKILQENKLPIVVGGTGLYIKALTNRLDFPNKAPDDKFRLKIEKLSLDDLQKKLQEAAPEKFALMNTSDRNNPRRLVRALEVSHFALQPKSITFPEYEYLVIGLKPPIAVLAERIEKRVEERLSKDLESELEIWRSIKSETPAKTSLGYKELDDFTQGLITKEQLLGFWTTRELQYAKRQLTWFKKQTGVEWVDIEEKNWREKVVAKVASWYHQGE